MKPKSSAILVQTEPETPAEVLASSIVEIAAGMKVLRSTRLSDKALVLLISNTSGQSQKAVRQVLSALEDLETTWLKPKLKEVAK